MANTAAIPRVASQEAYKVAWAIALIFYFMEYAVRAAPAVMVPELTSAFGVDAVGVSAIVGAYYYTYSVASLLAGAALDRFGAKSPVALGAVLLGLGCVIFIIPVPAIGYSGRLLQGLGSAFAFTGAVFLAAHGFSGRLLATVIGFTQSFGMLGGSAGQVGVGPLIHALLDWKGFWIAAGLFCFAIGAALFVTTPTETRPVATPKGFVAPFRTVFGNPQSWLCGIVAGLLFAPTTVGDMIWGVAFFQRDRGLDYFHAVSIASMTPLGWAVGCPLLGWLADWLGHRKFALMIGAAVMIASVVLVAISTNVTLSYFGMFMLGVGSGAAMIPYTIIKEVNPDEVKGSAVGVINFLTFSVTAAIGPLFASLIGKGLAGNGDALEHFRQASWFWLAVVVLAAAVGLLLRETGARGERASGE